MFADDFQALNVGLWVLGAVVVVQAVSQILSAVLNWRKLTVIPPVAEQFVTHSEIQALEARLTLKLNEQDARLTASEERTRQRIHELADVVGIIRTTQAAMPGLLHKDFESLLEPIKAKLELREPIMAEMKVKLDLLAGVLLPKKEGGHA